MSSLYSGALVGQDVANCVIWYPYLLLIELIPATVACMVHHYCLLPYYVITYASKGYPLTSYHFYWFIA